MGLGPLALAERRLTGNRLLEEPPAAAQTLGFNCGPKWVS